jgi:D-threo-aldose 1-dehydrogenase
VACVIGAIAPAEVAENLQMWHTPIPPALWADLRAAGLLAEAAPLPAPR